MGKFKKLPFEWNVDVSWLGMAKNRNMLSEPKILHYIGGGKKLPWRDQFAYSFSGVDYIRTWNHFYNDGEIV